MSEEKVVIDKKIGRNDPCVCGSGKKFKKCCVNKVVVNRPPALGIWSEGDPPDTYQVKECVKWLKETYPDYTIINVSDRLDHENYRMYQLKNYKHNVIMVLGRNAENELVFQSREKRPNDVDMMVLYHGTYRCYDSEGFEAALPVIEKMIKNPMS